MTTVLAKRMLESGGFKVLVGGNIGQALSTQVPASTPDVVHLVEVSSFQLEQTDTFRPSIGVCLNIFSDHLDRHGSMQAYAEAKGRIFANQKNTDWAVVNADDPRSLELADRSQARLLRFSMRTLLDEGIVIANDFVVYRKGQRDIPLIPLSAVRLLGQHLVGGVLAAASVSMLLGVTAEQMTSAVEGYTGLEHVLEPVAEIKGVRFVNDSKATNIEAVRRSVESFDGGVVVIMGGRFKGGNLRELRPVLSERAVAVFAIGEARSLIGQALGDVVPVSAVEGMAEAVRSAYAAVPQDGIVLLAPACASFDMYRDYAERGNNFKYEVKCLALELNSRREQ
jgi:UDP-N-acetylmuramoylalanine--D-glutamate ligase